MISKGIFMKDKTRYSLASKQKWEGKTEQQKKEHMSMMAKARWANKTLEEKRAHSLKMIEARNRSDNES